MPADASAVVAVAALLVTVELAVIGGIWKLATMLAEVRGEVRHNGGSSLKDNARDGAVSAKRAVLIADEARSQATQARVAADALREEVVATNAVQDHRMREVDTTLALVAARDERLRTQLTHLQEDVTGIRDGQQALTERVDEISGQTTSLSEVLDT